MMQFKVFPMPLAFLLIACVSTGAGVSKTPVISTPGQVSEVGSIPTDAIEFDPQQLQALGATPGGLNLGRAPRFGVSAHLQKYDAYHQTATNDSRGYANPERQRQALNARSQDLRLAREAGFSFVRTDFNWNWVEVIKGEYRFAAKDPYYNFDQIVADAASNGLGTMLILAYNNGFYSSVPVNSAAGLLGITTPEQRLAFANYVQASVAHFKGKDMLYEVWNEPNYAFFWNNPDPVFYAKLVNQSVAAARLADPQVQISTAGVWTSNPSFIKTSAENGALSSGADAFGLHPYRSIPETLIGGLEASNPKDLNLAGVRALIEPAANGRPIWNTEWGYSSFEPANRRADWKRAWGFDAPSESGNLEQGRGRQLQAVLGLRSILSGWLTGLPVMVWYDLRDDGSDGFQTEQNHGLLDIYGQPKPVYSAIKRFVQFTANRTLTASLPASVPSESGLGFHALEFGVGRYVVWLENLGLKRNLRFKSEMQAINLITGERLKSELCGDLEHRCVALNGIDGPLALESMR
jgi:Beta-galactosidase